MAKVPRESNSTRDPNDNGSQFYICVDDRSGLDRTYTVFGEVFRCMDVVDKIVATPRDEFDNPLQADYDDGDGEGVDDEQMANGVWYRLRERANGLWPIACRRNQRDFFVRAISHTP